MPRLGAGAASRRPTYPAAATAPIARKTSRRMGIVSASRDRGAELAVPGRAVGLRQQLRGLRVAHDVLFLCVPAHEAAHLQCDVGEVAGNRRLVAALEARDRLLPRLDA